MTRQAAIILSVVLSAVLLAGCSSENIAFGLTSDETVGNWNSADTSISVALAADGSLEATNWPSNLKCAENPAENFDDLHSAEPADFGGTWNSQGGDFPYQLTLMFSTEACPTGGGSAYVWRNADDSLALCIPIPFGEDPDGLRRDQMLILLKEGSDGTITSRACW